MKIEKTREKEISKHLSYVLRHRPDSIDFQLDETGWINIAILIGKIQITKEKLQCNENLKAFSLNSKN